MGRSKLRAALAAEKGIDFKKLKEKKRFKEKQKTKQAIGKGPKGGVSSGLDDLEEDEEDWEDEDEDSEEEEDEDDEDEEDSSPLIDDIAEESDEDGESEDEDESAGVAIGALDESDSESEVEFEEKIERPKKQAAPKSKPQPKSNGRVAGDEADEDEDEDEEDIAWSDLEDLEPEDREDLIPHQRQTINNHRALLTSLKRIQIATDGSVPFATHQCVVSSHATADKIPDVSDDLTRELQFYSQALEAAKKARVLLLKEKVPFSRPNDYFAEMVKDDGHMDKVKAKLVEEATAKKAATEARKQRDLKKFGKQVQVAKLQERQKAKKDTLEKIKSLKRKRQESSHDLPDREADLFDVAVDNELQEHKTRNRGGPGGSGAGGGKGRRGGGEGAPNPKRQKKNEKYGFGGKKRFNKSGDAVSSGDLSGFNARKMKAKVGGGGGKGAQRPGKARRKAAAAKR